VPEPQSSVRSRPLSEFFAPSSVAVIGATDAEHHAGRTVFENLLRLGRRVYAVNPRHATVLGQPAYAEIAAVPEPVDLAVIVTPAATVPGVVAQCAAAKVPAAIIISAGFRETGTRGAELEREILAARGSMRIIGPNCLGVMVPANRLNATFATTMPLPGSIAFLSQSGALCTAILDWSLRELVGFSAFISVGSMLDVGWGALIDYFGDDSRTHAILLYMESVGDAQSFLSAAREVALTKPIIVMKAGRSEQAALAAASHTGALTGSDAVLDAALRRVGVLRVRDIADLFHMAEVLGKQPRPAGPRLAIVTNAGGPGVLATDALMEEGAELAPLSADTIASLNDVLPQHWSHHNPVDIIGDATPERFSQAVEIVAQDPNTDGLLIALAPQVTDPTAVARRVEQFAKLPGKPVLASWMGGATVRQGEEILNAAGIPTFAYPDTAARIFAQMWHYSDNLRALYETPELAQTTPDQGAADSVLDAARREGRTLLSEAESKRLLASYGIPCTRTEVATTEDEAVTFASEIGYPVVLKLYSHTITHKSDVGGVELNLSDTAAVRTAWKRMASTVASRVGADAFQGVTVQPMIRTADGYELILGSSPDPQFGPVLLFGAGGQLVEIFRDHALGLPPLNSTLARRLMEQTRIYKALGGVRGRPPVERAQLEQVLVRFSQFIAEQPRVKEVDINPLLASAQRIVALDARVVLHDWTIPADQLPRAAIRPYPSAYVRKWKARDGSEITFRPIRPEDEPAMVRFHESLTDRSVYLRYFHNLPVDRRVAHDRLTRTCFIDYAREMVLVAETGAAEAAPGEIAAVGRLTREHGSADAEFALLVADHWQERGIGTELLRMLIWIAKQEGIRRISGSILPENRLMREVCQQLDFDLNFSPSDSVLEASLGLEPA
jgi:acetyltransferase